MFNTPAKSFNETPDYFSKLRERGFPSGQHIGGSSPTQSTQRQQCSYFICLYCGLSIFVDSTTPIDFSRLYVQPLIPFKLIQWYTFRLLFGPIILHFAVFYKKNRKYSLIIEFFYVSLQMHCCVNCAPMGVQAAVQILIGKQSCIYYLKGFHLQKSWKNFNGTSLGGSQVRRNRRALSSYFVPYLISRTGCRMEIL